MRLLLDAHVSSRRVGRALRDGGHDVLALDEDIALSAVADEEVLRLAAAEDRVVVTYNISDFIRIARRWAEADRHHAGLILVTSSHSDYGTVLRGVAALMTDHAEQADWSDRVVFLAEK